MNYSGKRLPAERGGDALPLAGSWVGAARSQIAAKSMHGIELVPVLDVRCFLAHQKYVTAVHGRGETIITESLRDLEAEFANAFVRVHRNALVSVVFIEGFERSAPRRYQLRLAGVERRVPVSRRHASAVRRRIQAVAGSKRRGEEFASSGGRGPLRSLPCFSADSGQLLPGGRSDRPPVGPSRRVLPRG